MRRFLRWLFNFFYRMLTKIDARGMENIPATGGCILATNHLSRLDPPLIYMHVMRNDLTGLVADKYQNYPLFRWIVNAANGIWIHREDADFGALRSARDYLVKGGILGIAPEGTRSKTGSLLPGKLGVAYLAAKAQVPVIPVGIYGTEEAMKMILSFKRPLLHIEFGKPIQLKTLEKRNRTELLQENTDEIMCQIAAMLPPAFHGHYSKHPRITEIIDHTIR